MGNRNTRGKAGLVPLGGAGTGGAESGVGSEFLRFRMLGSAGKEARTQF